jgi:hypothetical protein
MIVLTHHSLMIFPFEAARAIRNAVEKKAA